MEITVCLKGSLLPESMKMCVGFSGNYESPSFEGLGGGV